MLAACSGEARPDASDALSSSTDTAAAAAAADPDEAPPTELGAPTVCEPRAYRDCKIYYRDDSGQLQCPTQVQICAVDGSAWLACGEYVFDENGNPARRPD
ncbi:MAG: hypothetical protein JWP97_1671 [Labilithrix sp.]|nr:hypothetical protein [Labilithrix sp.]